MRWLGDVDANALAAEYKSLAAAGLRDVGQFEMRRVASRFIKEVAKIVPAIKVAQGSEVEHAS